MNQTATWDWDTKEKYIADVNKWRKKFPAIRELFISDDGEKIATVIQTEDNRFTTCVNGDVWEETFERLWSLKFTPDNKLICLAYRNYEWALGLNNELWEDRFDSAWNLTVSPDGKSIALNVKKEELYGASLNGATWENRFVDARDIALSPDGTKTASLVQTKRLKEGDIFGFQEGIWTVAVDGIPWDRTFVNVWGITFSPDSKHVAVEVRLNLYDYTIAVDGKPWEKVYGCVWEPFFKPYSDDIIAPVKTSGGWTLAMNGQPIWDTYVQVRNQRFSPDGRSIAAVVAPEYGKWTIAVENSPWKRSFGDAVLPPIFSPDSKRVAAVGKESRNPFHMESALHNIEENDRYSIAVDGTPWPDDFEMVWDPIFSPGSDKVLAKVEKNGKYFIVIDGRIGKHGYEDLWNPVFSPDGEKLLIRCIEGGKYYRRVIPINEI